eukprot:gene4694-6592_t
MHLRILVQNTKYKISNNIFVLYRNISTNRINGCKITKTWKLLSNDWILSTKIANLSFSSSSQNKPTSSNRKTRFQPPETYDFKTEYKLALDQVEKSVEHMKALNKYFEVERGFDENGNELLLIQVEKGNFLFKKSKNEDILAVQSYVTGFHLYSFDQESKQWLSIKDGHDMRGLVTRDFLRHCIGYPLFN